jgi:hypothetical protein
MADLIARGIRFQGRALTLILDDERFTGWRRLHTHSFLVFIASSSRMSHFMPPMLPMPSSPDELRGPD